MTEIYLHIDARMDDYIRTHPYDHPAPDISVSVSVSAQVISNVMKGASLLDIGGMEPVSTYHLPTVCFQIIRNLETMHD
eukprot:COSAG05_NODE_631_length_8203_cov_23.575148_6_plen_79_part_00